jgi:hypothetical protein
MGFALSIYIATAATPLPINQLHLLAFFLAGIVMVALLVFVGGFFCTMILGKDWPKYVYGGAKETPKNDKEKVLN